MYVLPCPFPNEVVKGEHFVIADLLKSLPRGSTSVEAVPEPLVRLYCLPLALVDPKLAPQAVTKKKKKFGQAKAADKGLEGYIDCTNPTVSQSIEKREIEMFGLVAGFSIWMPKQAVIAQEGTTPGLEVLGDKRPKPSKFEEEVQADPTVITMDSPE